ncbi:MAG: cytochrome P450 [Gammaproteobacteria bacterium]|nr:cytochrome P450 [Gammaproteobacteria bacterium]
MSDNNTPPVKDWATDYDIFDSEYVRDPAPIWDELRERCPIAHTTRWGGSWLPTRYDDLQAMVRMVPALSSRSPTVVPPSPELREELIREAKEYSTENPPITADPPEQIPYRRLILPFFSPKAVAGHRQFTLAICNEMIDRFIDKGHADAAADYAQQIPPRVIAHVIGIDPKRVDDFVKWTRGILEIGQLQPDMRIKYCRIIRSFFEEMVADRRQNPRDDLISTLIDADIDGKPLSDYTIVGMCNLLLVAGIDTTWSSIGSALWHFASHTDDRRRLAKEPELLITAIEELLRFYSPVTMARKVTQPVSIGDVTFQPGDKVLLNFPAANRDPSAFDKPNEVVLDRKRNRHIAFGVGIHRCAGSNLARMEMEVALGTWFSRIPEFELACPDAVTWVGGQVRGPRCIPVRFSAA